MVKEFKNRIMDLDMKANGKKEYNLVSVSFQTKKMMNSKE